VSVQTGPETHKTYVIIGTGFFLGVKRPKRDTDHPPTSNAEVATRLRLCLRLPLHASIGMS